MKLQSRAEKVEWAKAPATCHAAVPSALPPGGLPGTVVSVDSHCMVGNWGSEGGCIQYPRARDSGR